MANKCYLFIRLDFSPGQIRMHSVKCHVFLITCKTDKMLAESQRR